MPSFFDRLAPRPTGSQIELQAESIAVSIRWFGLVVGAVVANSAGADPRPLNIILLLGLAYTVLDTAFFLRGRVFLRDLPLGVSALEALFITLLCYFEHGLDSPFRFYYLLSLVCGAVRHPPRVTLITCGLNCLSYSTLLFFVPVAPNDWRVMAFTLVVLLWVTAAAVALARLLKRAAAELATGKEQLETRIAERTQELEESQAQVLHQEKMAAFGLLAAGIAHEVGNPLTSISAVVQMLDRRDLDAYTREKLTLVTGQLARIQTTLRELVMFSRPATNERGRVSAREVVDEALSIAKYYRGGKSRTITADVPADLPPLPGVRDQLVQVVFNLVLNAIDATGKGGQIGVTATANDGHVELAVADDGAGIPPDVRPRLFRPYFTTKPHGTGLGLFVLRRIVEAHGGRVAVESTPGAGTTFRVTLPAVVPRADALGTSEAPMSPRTPHPPPVQPASILVIDDEPVIRDTLAEFLRGEGYAVAAAESGERAVELASARRFDVALCDVNLPGMDGLDVLDRLAALCPETFVILITAYATVETAVEAFQKGAHDYLVKPILLHDVHAKIARLLRQRDLYRENQWLRRELTREAEAGELVVGRTPAMKRVMDLARRVAPTPSTVLILGESGTGKDVVARVIHRLAQAAKPTDGRFVPVNCAAIPPELMEAQLFGHRKGAFTGADRDSPGVFVHAAAGTVFLDEVGELPLPTQAKLLRAIEQKEVLPVGASEPVRVQARILAATNKNLEKEATASRFRQDLFFRLNVVSLTLPPLRDRRDDLPELAAFLLARHAEAAGKPFTGLSHEAMQAALAYPWPGNVRELDNALQRAVILGEPPLVLPEDLPPNLTPPAGEPAGTDDLRVAVARFERQHIARVLEHTPDKREAAKRLGISLSSLYRKIEESEAP